MIVWTTARGEELTLEQISNPHLLNIITFLDEWYEHELIEGLEAMTFVLDEQDMPEAMLEVDSNLRLVMRMKRFFVDAARERGLV